MLQVATARIDQGPGILPMPREGEAMYVLCTVFSGLLPRMGCRENKNTRYVVGRYLGTYIAKLECLGKPTCSRAFIESGAKA